MALLFGGRYSFSQRVSIYPLLQVIAGQLSRVQPRVFSFSRSLGRLLLSSHPTFALGTLDFIIVHCPQHLVRLGNSPSPTTPHQTTPQIATMRFSSTLLLALPAIAVAEEQIPLLDKVKGFFNKATAAVSSSIPAPPSNPINAAADKAASKAAAAIQHTLTLENWREILTVDPTASPPTTQDWLVFVTGGNSTCYGMCGNATKAWNVCTCHHYFAHQN